LAKLPETRESEKCVTPDSPNVGIATPAEKRQTPVIENEMIWKVVLMSNAKGVRVVGPMGERYDEVLTPEALALLGALHREFDSRRRDLLALRGQRAAMRAAGEVFAFLPDTVSALRKLSHFRSLKTSPLFV
jgi:hypothetical protein